MKYPYTEETRETLIKLKENIEANDLSLNNFYLYRDSRISITTLHLIDTLYNNQNLNKQEKKTCQTLIESLIKSMGNIPNPDFETELVTETCFINRLADILPKCSAEKREKFKINVLSEIDKIDSKPKKKAVKIIHKSH